MDFTATISGRRFRLAPDRVTHATADVLPDPLRDHYVVIGGRRYPPKQVIALVTGLDRADFTTHQARRILARLGFPVARRSNSARMSPGRGPSATPSPAEALRPYIGQWVATDGDEVLVGADSPAEVVSWLTRHNRRAQSMFRVPAGDAEAGGVAPL